MRPEDDPMHDKAWTEADETSHTRFGPRPVPENHQRHDGPIQSRRIPPSGDVSPDGRHAWPKPSQGARWLVWGGTALGAAALTAGAVLAGRQVCDMMSSRGHPAPTPRRTPQPQHRRMVLDDEVQDVPRRRPAPPPHADRPSARRAPPRQNLMQEIQTNTASLTENVDSVMRALTGAVLGFRSVAGQASGIIREFSDAAHLVQDIIGRREPASQAAPARSPRPDDRHGTHMPDLRDDPLTHDPMDGPDADEHQPGNPRMHRL